MDKTKQICENILKTLHMIKRLYSFNAMYMCDIIDVKL